MQFKFIISVFAHPLFPPKVSPVPLGKPVLLEVGYRSETRKGKNVVEKGVP